MVAAYTPTYYDEAVGLHKAFIKKWIKVHAPTGTCLVTHT